MGGIVTLPAVPGKRPFVGKSRNIDSIEPMTLFPFARHLTAKWTAFAFVSLVILPSCAMEPVPAPRESRNSPGHVARPQEVKKKTPRPASTIRRAKDARPDPRYRPPANFAELQAVAGEVANATGRKINWHLQRGAAQGPLVSIRGTLQNCTITVHPVAAQKVPPNTWAFLFGHEFAHLVEELGTHSATNPATELKADIAGARYAMAAGYRIEAFLGWVLTEPNKETRSHGSLERRVKAISTHFGVPKASVQAEARRAADHRAKR